MTKPDLQVFKTNRKLYWTNELKSWVWSIFFAVLLFFVLQLSSLLKEYNLTVGIWTFILLKLGNMVRQYHVTEIRFDKQNNQLTFILKSILSGEKNITHDLEQVSSALIHNSGLKMILSAPLILKISLAAKDTFTISDRYGFSKETLTAIDNTINNFNK